MTALLSVRDLATSFSRDGRVVRAVDGVSFDVAAGEVFGIVGESGCGKSATCRSIIRLFAGSSARIERGEILFRGEDLARLPEAALARRRGSGIGMIFQDPMTSLNPTMRVGRQITEALRRRMGRREALKQAVGLLDRAGIPAAASRMDAWPHEFSGGMRQRVMIALALAGDPSLLIADEPTTALDVTIQDQILKLILALRAEFGMGVILVTHDLGVVAQTCDRVAVMYAGRIVETAATAALFARPRHPYTAALIGALPSRHRRGEVLEAIAGAPPDLAQSMQGCRFKPRCRMAEPACAAFDPVLLAAGADHLSACRRHAEMQA